MKLSNKKSIKSKNFLILIIIFILLALSLWFVLKAKPSGKKVRISHDNEEIMLLNLDEDGTYPIEFGEDKNILVLKDGTAEVIEANCENQICVNTPAASKVGDTIVCLPHKLVVEIIEN